MLKVQAASWTSGAAETQTVLQSKLCLSMDVQTAQIDSITKGIVMSTHHRVICLFSGQHNA